MYDVHNRPTRERILITPDRDWAYRVADGFEHLQAGRDHVAGDHYRGAPRPRFNRRHVAEQEYLDRMNAYVEQP